MQLFPGRRSLAVSMYICTSVSLSIQSGGFQRYDLDLPMNASQVLENMVKAVGGFEALGLVSGMTLESNQYDISL